MTLKDGKKKKKLVYDLRRNATCKTRLVNKQVYKKMKWDKIEVEEKLVKEGMLVDSGLLVIKSDDYLHSVWDLEKYEFLLKDSIPDTVNPKLWEQGKLNLNAGLFQVSENIYQIRGFDVANMTFIRGRTGWIVIDTLTCMETAEAAINLVNDYFGEVPISAVIITHSHVDHYGGILSAINNFAKKDTRIYAPKNYINSVIDENVDAGTAMFRRAKYMYGLLLPKGEKGQIDIGIGKGLSAGSITFSQNVHEIEQDYEKILVDGIYMEFLLALNTEAPSEMFVYVPSEKSLCIAEDCNETLHNLITLRGAKVRDAVAWTESIQNAIDLWGSKLTSVFCVHTWPRFGNDMCIDFMEKQRDLYQYINDQTLRLINQGYTIEDVGRMVKVPNSLSDEWYNSEFYGTVNFNAKAVYQKYIGWYNSNPVDLNKLRPQDSAKKYVEYMGGEDIVLMKAKTAFINGEYQWVAEVTKQVIFANPNNKQAKLICADALEQLGYIAESGVWRNEYLMGAQELRYGKIQSNSSIITNDVLNNMPLGDVLYLFSIRVEGLRAGDYNYKINFFIPNRKEVASTELKRGVFRYLNDKLAKDAAVTVTMSKETLYELAITNNKPDNSKILIEGDINKWNTFLLLQDTIDPNFNIVTPVQK